MARFLWVQKQDVGPSARFAQAMAFDANRGRVLLFGGSTGPAIFRDTWEWDGALWTQVADTGPDARGGHAMAYDAARGRTVLFGGLSGTTFLNDTWEWDGTDWTQVADTGPSVRAFHAIAFDSSRNVTVLFGGDGAAGVLQDTWEWDGTDWVQTQDVGPPARRRHAMTFDTTDARTILFGGSTASGAGLDDTWSYDGTNWTHVQDIGPGPCVGAAMIFTGSHAILFGGIDTADASIPAANHHLNNETWQLEGERWTQVQDMGPKARWQHSMTFNSQTGRIVLFGGLSLFAPDGDASLATGALADTWEHADQAGAGGGPQVTLVDLSFVMAPQLSDFIGAQADVSFTLSGPAPGTGATLVMAVFEGDGSTQQQVSPLAIMTPGPLQIGPGEAAGTFTIQRGTDSLAPGQYTLAAAVEGTQDVLAAAFQLI